MTESCYRNQAGIINIEEHQHLDIAIAGLGSIGSFLAMALNKLGFRNLVVIDYDQVETHNIPTQYYQKEDIGEFKAIAMKRYLQGNISAYTGKVGVSEIRMARQCA